MVVVHARLGFEIFEQKAHVQLCDGTALAEQATAAHPAFVVL